MKKYLMLSLLSAGFVPGALVMSSCSKADQTVNNSEKIHDDARDAVATAGNAISDSWDGIRDYAYERRSDFSAAVDRMSMQWDGRERDFKSKMAGSTGDSVKAKQDAIKAYDDSRAVLKSKLEDLRNASAANWTEAKGKVADAWQHVQAAGNNLK